MRSYTEIQQRMRKLSNEIRKMSNEISELSRDLSKLMAVQSKKAINLQRITATGSRFPLRGHYLVEQEHKLQNAYLTLLTAVAMQSENNPVAGLQQVQRILSALTCKKTLEQLVADASTLKEEQLDTLTKTVNAASEAVEPWLLDAILLCIAGGNSAKQREFLSGIVELIGARETQVANMAKLAAAINRKDTDAIGQCWENTDITRFHEYFVPHRGEPLIIKSGKKIMLIGDGQTPTTPNLFCDLHNDQIKSFFAYHAVIARIAGSYSLLDYLHLEDCVVRDVNQYDDHLFKFTFGKEYFETPHKGYTKLINCSFRNFKCHDAIRLNDNCELKNVRIENIETSKYDGCAIWLAGNIFVNGLTLSDISGKYVVYTLEGSITFAGDCTYHNCSGYMPDSFLKNFRKI